VEVISNETSKSLLPYEAIPHRYQLVHGVYAVVMPRLESVLPRACECECECE